MKVAVTSSRTVALVAVLVAFCAAGVLAAVKVQVTSRPEVDFTALKSWRWNPAGPGTAKRAVSKDDADSATLQKELEPRLMPIVEAEFARRGFPISQSVQPDFFVTYYALVTVGNSSQVMGQFINMPAMGLPPFAPQTTSLEYFQTGTLVLDVTSREKGEVVWRGIAQARLDWNEPEKKRVDRLRDAVQELVKRFPPKKK